jgi:hypothetical protein
MVSFVRLGFDHSYSFLFVFVSGTKPDRKRASLGVNLTRLLNLGASICYIALVNAQGFYPHNSFLILATEVL